MNIKRITAALKETIFYCAAVHLFLLAVQVIRSGDFSFFSMASIFDMKLFMPDIDYGSLSVALISLLPVIALFIWQYSVAGKRKS
jgi:hypothetical protein